jgi:hypothetical protein
VRYACVRTTTKRPGQQGKAAARRSDVGAGPFTLCLSASIRSITFERFAAYRSG